MSADEELSEDPCRAQDGASGERTLVFVMLFFLMFGGGIFAILSNWLPGILFASALGYTACVMIYGFAKNRGNIPRYLFTCPVVVSQRGRLLKRHAVFLAMLIVIVWTAVRIKPHLSDSSAGSRNDAFFFILGIPVAVLALTEIMTNRGVLERAHNDRFGEPPAPDDPNRTLSLFDQNQ